MEIIFGILFGCLCGIFLGLAPGFNIGLAYIGAVTLPVEPRFAVGTIMGIEITYSALSHLNLLNSKHRDDLDDHVKIANKEELCLTSINGYMFSKILLTWTLAFVIFTGPNSLDLGKFTQEASLVIAVTLWIIMLQKSKHWKIATIALIGFSLLTIFTVELPIKQPMFILVSALYSSNLINNVRYKQEKIVLNNIKAPSDLQLEGMFAGFISGLLWGLPTSAFCSAMKSVKKERANTTVNRKAVADGATSVVGITLLMASGSAKTAAASSAATFNIQFHYTEIIILLIVQLGLSLLIYWNWRSLMQVYAWINNHTPHFFHILTVIITVISLTIMSNGYFWLIALTALMLNKLIKQAEAPKELSLVCISILPVLAILSKAF